MEKPFFSILLPVYNTEKYLPRALDSCLAQTFYNIEIIVVNDCSPDSSAEILKEYERKDSRIKIITHEKNSGTLLARKTAMEAACGEYILFLDSDDYLESSACERIYSKLKTCNCDILEFGYICEPIGKKIYPDKRIDNRLGLLFTDENPMLHTSWNKAYKKELVKKVCDAIEPLYIVLVDDCYLAVLFYTFSKSIFILNEVLHHYVVFIGVSTSKQITKEQLQKNIQYLNTLKSGLQKFLKEYNPKNERELSKFMNRLYFDQYYYITQKEIPVDLKFSLVLLLDEHFNTNFTQLLREKYEKKAELYDTFVNSTFPKRIYLFLSYNYHVFANMLMNSKIFKR